MTITDLLVWFIGTGLSVSILVIMVLLVRRPVARRFGAQAAYALWLAPLGRIFLPTLEILPGGDKPAERAPGGQLMAADFNPSVQELMITAPAGASDGSLWHWVTQGGLVTGYIGGAILSVWMAGTLCLLLQTFFAHYRFRQALLRTARAPNDEVRAETHLVARNRGYSRPVSLRIAGDDSGPLVCGLLAPVIFMPQRFETAFTSAERQLAIAHEIAHIQRGDLWGVMLASLVRALFWPSPFVHAAFHALRSDQEAACDADVLDRQQDRKAALATYVGAIGKSLPSAQGRSPAVGVPITALTIAHPLKERLTLMKIRQPARTRNGVLAVSALIATGLITTAPYSQAETAIGQKVTKEIRALTSDDATGTDEKATTKTTRKVITTDGDETIQIEGFNGERARKVDFRTVNGVREMRIYGADGTVLTEEIFGPEEDLPYGDVIILKQDGETHRVTLQEERVIRLDGDKVVWLEQAGAPLAPTPSPMPDAPVPASPPASPPAPAPALSGTWSTTSAAGFCDGGDGQVFVVDDGDVSGPGSRPGSRPGSGSQSASGSKRIEIVCLDGKAGKGGKKIKGDNEAAAIQRAIDALEQEARKADERRQATIDRLKKRLEALEE